MSEEAERVEKILVVDDDPCLCDLVLHYLTDFGFQVLVAGSGESCLRLLDSTVDALVLDLELPGIDGLEVLRRVRQRSALPVLILSARGEGADRVAGLELGADDYLTKPFLPRELVARLRALLRRARPSSSGPIQIDPVERRVIVDGECIDLTPKEYDLLALLSQAPGRTFSREELLERVWGTEHTGETRRVDLQISRLRTKLTRPGRPAPISSIWGVGYRFSL